MKCFLLDIDHKFNLGLIFKCLKMFIWSFNRSFKDINYPQQNHDINIWGCLVNQTLLILILIKYTNQ